MATRPKSPILLVTRGLIYAIMGLVALTGVTIALVALALPFYWTEAARQLTLETPTLDAAALYPRLYLLFVLGLVTLALIWAIMRKLLAIVGSVALGDPFAMANAARLKAVGWLMIALQLVGIPLAITAGKAANLFGENDVGLDISLNAILSILLVFVLAGVFEHGAAMREELEGTV